MEIKGLANELIEKYMTCNPIEIAEELGIKIFIEDLGDINGFYNTYCRRKIIHINKKLKGQRMLFTAAHELGHAILHPDYNTPFMKNHTYFSVNKYEIEANKFASYLLIGDSELQEMFDKEYTNDQIASCFGFSLDLIELRMQDFIK